MATDSISFIVDRDLLNANFDGYKLKLAQSTPKPLKLNNPVHQVCLNFTTQWSRQHAHLFSSHNHAHRDKYAENCQENAVYSFVTVDTKMTLAKLVYDSTIGQWSVVNQLIDAIDIPTGEAVNNATLQFAAGNMAVVCDGYATVCVYDTGDRSTAQKWKLLQSVTLPTSTAHTIYDAYSNPTGDACCMLIGRLHAIDHKSGDLRNVRQGSFMSVVEAVMLNVKTGANFVLRSQSTHGLIHAAYFHDDKLACVIASHPFVTPTVDGEEEGMDVECQIAMKKYVWTQTAADVTIDYPVSAAVDGRNVRCTFTQHSIHLTVVREEDSAEPITLLQGEFHGGVDVDSCSWVLADNVIRVTLCKSADASIAGQSTWPELLNGCARGDFIPNAVDLLAAVQSLQTLTSASEEASNTNYATNSNVFDHMESCDVGEVGDGCYWRGVELLGEGKVVDCDLMGRQFLFVERSAGETNICIRYDVDAVVFAIRLDGKGDVTLEHRHTYDAFGYVQASKENRKFLLSSSPTHLYTTVVDSVKRAYLYMQPACETVLTNRTTKQMSTTHVQRLITLDTSKAVIGAMAYDGYMIVLTEEEVCAVGV